MMSITEPVNDKRAFHARLLLSIIENTFWDDNPTQIKISQRQGWGYHD